MQADSLAPDDAPAERVLKFSDFVFNDWERLANSDNDLVGLTTGIGSLDIVTTGIRPGETWAIGGRTGDGKTSLALQIAAANCRRDIAVGYFSIEMSKSELLQKLAELACVFLTSFVQRQIRSSGVLAGVCPRRVAVPDQEQPW